MPETADRCPGDLAVTRAADTGGIVTGWLIRCSLSIAVLGVVGFDVISFAASHLSVQDHAHEAAVAAAQTWESTRDEERSYAAAVHSSRESRNGSVVDRMAFSVSPEGEVRLTVRQNVHTVVAHHIPPLRKWLAVVGEATVDATR